MPYKREDSKHWWVALTDPRTGQRIRRSTGTTSKKEAEALEGLWRSQLHRQAMWGEEPEHTFEDVATEYLLASTKKRSLDDIKDRVRKLREFFGGRVMNELRGRDVIEFIAWRRQQGVSDSTINREISTLAAAINYTVVQMEWKIPNPCVGKKLSEPESIVRWITRAEAVALINEAHGLRCGHILGDFIELALHTGCRMNELLTLEWRNVDLRHDLITLDPDRTKTGKRRTVPLNDVARSAIMHRKAFVSTNCPSSPWVFAKKDGQRYVAPREGFKKACKLAGIKNFRIHDMRHTCASWLVSDGVPLADVKEVLGHSSITQTEKYAHLAPHRARDAVTRLVTRSSHVDRPERDLEGLLERKKKVVSLR